MTLERLQSYPIICQGGLDSNENHLFLSTVKPGSATTLINYEPGLFGGYRKLDGFEPLEADFPDVDDAGSEGKILGIAIYNQGIIAARKTQSAAVYNFFFWTLDSDWTAYTTGLTLTVTNLDKIRYATFNFDGTEKVVFTDGINNATLHDGTNWTNVDPAGTGADFANAGGPMALAAPKFVAVFKNHVFVSGDATDPHIVAHSAPNAEYDWTAAAGAGQINVGFAVKQIKPFRNELFVLGETKIKKIVVDGTDFVLQDVTNDIGCLASDSVIEYNGDIFFLSQDGIRTIAATDRVGDIELAVQSKTIQQDLIGLIDSYDMSQVNAVVVRNKSQMRFFFSDSTVDPGDSVGVLGAIRGGHEIEHTGTGLEWGRILGIRTSCVTSAYIGTEEYILHGDYNGKVYRQESGFSFDGESILTVYTMPYIDFGDVFIRKNLHKVLVFLRPETAGVSLNASIQYDWDNADVLNPSSYIMESDIAGSFYGSGIYDTSVYATEAEPVIFRNVEGGGFSARVTFSTSDDTGSHSIQAVVFEYHVEGRK